VARLSDGLECELWLRSECCGDHVIWAHNLEHLDYLERYVGAGLRERNPTTWKSAGLSWRLPGWMKEAGNRDELLRHFQRLRASLA
jgi:hypothetical protein